VSELAGVGVLVTRPEAQAGPLARALEELGAQVFRLPTLEIRPRADRAATRAAVGPVDRFHWVIFVSANAVRYGATLVDATKLPRLATVGPATAVALKRAGHGVDLTPGVSFDSEQLLCAEEFHAVAGQRVLLVRGSGGRDLLADTLRDRGAEVVVAEVYERAPAVPLPGAVAALERAWRAGAISVVSATSVEVLQALVELLSPEGRALLEDTLILAGGRRIAAAAQHMGLRGEIILAASPESGALVDALLRWRRHTRPL
jgi:uroporphyrinogen-III synthase